MLIFSLEDSFFPNSTVSPIKIMEANKEIVDFNNEQISINSSLLDGELKPNNATPEANAKTISDNAAAMDGLENRTTANRSKMESLVQKSEENSQSLSENKASIKERRVQMMANRAKISVNKSKIFS